MALTTALSMLHYVAGNEDRNLVDRMHSYFTTNLLIGLAVLVSFKQFGGKPLECLVPDLFSGAWEQDAFVDFIDASCLFTTNILIAIALVQSYKQFSGKAIECLTPDPMPFEGAEEYAEQYCFAQDTYYIPMKSTVADVNQTERRERKISYYQWVPFFLLISAACFRLPSLLWKHFSDYSGIRIQQIVKLASDANNIKPDIKAANIRSLCVHLQGALRFHRRLQKRHIKPHRFLRIFNVQYSAYYVSLLYLLTKLCYLLNVAGQLYMMNRFYNQNNRFLGTTKHAFYGFGAIFDLFNGTTWEQSGMFPRVSLCDFEVRVMGNVQDYTIQCVLVINIFNEKIFIFLWFWYIFLLVFTFGSFVYWSVVAFCPCYNTGYIAKHLEMSEEDFNADDYDSMTKVGQFVRTYLKADGMFAIRMLSTYSGVIFGTDLVRALWCSYHGIEMRRRCNSLPDLKKQGDSTAIDIDESVNKFNDWRLRRLSHGRSFDGELSKIPPPTPPPELMKLIFDKGTESSNSSPLQYQREPVKFDLYNNSEAHPHKHQGHGNQSAPSDRPNSNQSRRGRSRSPPPQLSQRRVGGQNSDNSSVL